MERVRDVPVDLAAVEDDDGVVDLVACVARAPMPVLAIPAGPRRWALHDVSAEEDAHGRVVEVRLLFRCDPVRTVVVASEPQARAAGDPDGLARRVATGLAFEGWRRAATPQVAPFRALGAGDLVPAPAGAIDGLEQGPWRAFAVPGGPGEAPVRVLVGDSPHGRGDGVVVAGAGVAFSELATLAGAASPCGREDAERLQVEHRRRLAQRWWDAPRTPWRPDQRTAELQPHG